MAKIGAVCGQCGGRYRGSWTDHAGTIAHRAKVERRTRNRLIAKSWKRDAREAHARRASRVAMRPSDTGHLWVRAYRRRRPDDGPRRDVRVVRHLRGLPRVESFFADIAGQRTRVFRHLATRKVFAIEIAGRRVAL